MKDHPYIKHLIHCIELEEAEEFRRYSTDQGIPIKQLVSQGVVLYPIKITKKTFGFADYPEFAFRLNFISDQHQFYGGASIQLFKQGEEAIKGVLLTIEGRLGECRLYAPDFPDWLEDDGVGVQLIPDVRTIQIMKQGLYKISENAHVLNLFKNLHEVDNAKRSEEIMLVSEEGISDSLNHSQKLAVQAILQNEDLVILHGPPGTGKTVTLIDAIRLLVSRGEKVLVTAPSNTATDHVALGLIAKGIKIIRVGNTTKVDEAIYPYTAEGRMQDEKIKKQLKELRIRAVEFRKMALQYKRRFGKAEREQRSLLFKEVKEIRNEIRKIQDYHQDKFFEEADVIVGTPIALVDAGLKPDHYNTLIIDEAGQCLEPLAWAIFPFAKKYVLAGDPFQLPPTVLSDAARKKGLNCSILELCHAKWPRNQFLDTQYRMREVIAGFSSEYFYQGQLKTPKSLQNSGNHMVFIDTAGSGNNEESGNDGTSLMNTEEIGIAIKLIDEGSLNTNAIVFISPYSGQVAKAIEMLPKKVRVSTIDSYQGKEKEIVMLSLVRSNDEGQIGFLKDYRRMNVALTRAKEKLIVIGDSATLGQDAFYKSFLSYVEDHGIYRSVWEFM